MALTPEQQQAELEALRLEVRLHAVYNQLTAKCPELLTIYDLPENGVRMALWLNNQTPPLSFTLENLVLAFERNKHLFARKETEEERAANVSREYHEKIEREKAAARAERERQQNKQQPLTHISHVQLARDRKAAEIEKQKAAKAMREEIEKLSSGGPSSPPTIYFPEQTKDGRANPLAGKVDWGKTYAERKRLGFDVSEGKQNIKLKGE